MGECFGKTVLVLIVIFFTSFRMYGVLENFRLIELLFLLGAVFFGLIFLLGMAAEARWAVPLMIMLYAVLLANLVVLVLATLSYGTFVLGALFTVCGLLGMFSHLPDEQKNVHKEVHTEQVGGQHPSVTSMLVEPSPVVKTSIKIPKYTKPKKRATKKPVKRKKRSSKRR